MIGFRVSSAERCQHSRVSPDPLLGGYYCPDCLTHFKIVPDALVLTPRAMTLWQRLRWAVTTRTKVRVVPHVWTVAWANARNREDHVPTLEPKGWRVPRERRGMTPAELDRVYDHPASKPPEEPT